MPKADHALSTSKSTSQSRRSVMAVARGVTPPEPITVPNPSKELLAYRTARKKFLAAQEAGVAAYGRWVAANSNGQWQTWDAFLCSSFDSKDPLHPRAVALLNRMDGETDTSRYEQEWNAREASLEAAIAALIARPVRSAADLAELVELLRTEQFWFADNEHYDEVQCRELDALFAGITSLAGGGADG
jgi:hypothetical protein